MRVRALRNTWMKQAKIHGFDGRVSTVCDTQIYSGVNGWQLVEVMPEEITCAKCMKLLFPVPASADLEKMAAWVNGEPIKGRR